MNNSLIHLKMKFKKVTLKTSKDCCLIANRHAVILKYKKPFIAWEKKQNPWKDSDPLHNVDKAPARISLFMKTEADPYEKWLNKNFKLIFEEELECWVLNKKFWPQKRTYLLFRRWFDISFTPYIIDEDAGKVIEMV